MSLIFIFLDGVGLAPAGPDNPLTDAATPALRALLGGPLTIEQVSATKDERPTTKEDAGLGRSSFVVRQVLLKPIDATLGVAGLPQSGTGHTALLAGVNAPALHGHHQPHFPPVALRPLLAERSIFRRVVARGGRAAFANAFGPGYWDAVAARRIRRSASVIAAEGAGLRFRDGDDLRHGRALSWDVTGAAMRDRGVDAPIVGAAEAGANLARLAANHDLVFYESFLPDLAGHGRLTDDQRPRANDQQPEFSEDDSESLSSLSVRPWSVAAQIQAVMALLDGLIGGALGELRAEDTLLITSDHGNVESLAAPAHTYNPVPLLAVGAAAQAFTGVASIVEVADVIDTVTR
ncbi:MAG: metalloenzyme [Kouleothrix sp.]|nr:metalloenzyme [Kouleothrix sp.]